MNRLKTAAMALSAALTIGGLATLPAFAWTDRFHGKPDSLHPGGTAGYYIWNDDDGLHLRTNGPGPRHEFSGTLRTNGTFRGVQLIRTEGDDRYTVSNDAHEVQVHFETWDGIDGIDFHIDGGDGLRLALRADGDLIPTNRIFLGEDSKNPQNNPFSESR